MNTRLEIASRILQGFAANPAVFAANGMTGWGLVNCDEAKLSEYCIKLTDALIRREAMVPRHGPISGEEASVGKNPNSY